MTRRSDWLVGQLPVGMLDDDFFVRFTSLFENLATSFLEGADNIGNVVDARVTPVPFIGWLGSWIGIHSVDSSMDEALQRRLVRQASQGLAWRGTRRGLQQFLEVITDGEALVEESGGILREGEAGDRVPHVRIQVTSIGGLSVEDFVGLVADEIPVNVAYELFVGDVRLWPPPEGSGWTPPESNGHVPTGAQPVAPTPLAPMAAPSVGSAQQSSPPVTQAGERPAASSEGESQP